MRLILRHTYEHHVQMCGETRVSSMVNDPPCPSGVFLEYDLAVPYLADMNVFTKFRPNSSVQMYSEQKCKNNMFGGNFFSPDVF